MADRRRESRQRPGTGRRARGVVLALIAGGSLATGCSGGAAEDSGFIRTGAVAPDACTLINASLARDLVGDHTVTRAKRTDGSSGCSWQAPLSTDLSKLSGLLNVSVVTETLRRSGSEKYGSAKTTYRGLQNDEDEDCSKLSTSADEACWQKGRESLSVIARQGYTVLKADYTATNSPALKEQNMENTAKSLLNEMISHVRS
ncbi:hypothetical protein [Actinomadura nitritigenes]|uniref:hypothetical protein n=1 Tax=Actinomadura nitritigenes TaxID=134602 RepID=UPI003D8DEDBF